jgi:hypothetical protein
MVIDTFRTFLHSVLLGVNMLTTIQGIYRNGTIQLTEIPRDVDDETPVIVTFLTGNVDLATRGMDEKQAADLRARLATFAEEWESPEMDIYDNYDAAKTNVLISNL